MLFYVQGRDFIEAGSLLVGDKLISINGRDLIVEDYNIELTEEPVSVYNFQVENFHTYHVGIDVIFVHNAEYPNEDVKVGSQDIQELRDKYDIPETNTVAVGKTDIPGLEDITFEGGSPKVRQQLGMLDLDTEMPGRSIKAPSNNPLFTRHAEEVVANKSDTAVQESGIPAEDVSGTLSIHRSNPSGVCKKCIQGLNNNSVQPGVLKQLSLKYPNLIIKVTSELNADVKVTGRSELIIKNGEYVNY